MALETDIHSPSGEVELWITINNVEITIGLTGRINLHDWHTHFTPYEFDDLETDIIGPAVEQIANILSDNSPIYKSNLKGYSLFKSKAEPDEKIEQLKWSRA
jgi:hypothetical protein